MTDDITSIVIVSAITILVLVILTIFLFSIFYKSKAQLETEKLALESEVSRSQIEIREEFMRNVGKELHDNIGQVLSTAKLQLSMSESRAEHTDSIALIAKSLNDIRNLSKVVDPDAVGSFGLLDSCKIEIERLERLPHINALLHVEGISFTLDQKVEIILFRIIQESINNSLKHSKSNKIELSLTFDNPKIIVNLKDYGVGFDTSKLDLFSGSGLRNIRQRAEMIGASYKIESNVGEGTNINITYKMHPNEQIPNRDS